MVNKQTTPSQESDKYLVRFKDGMRSTIKSQAAQNNRTMNAEILTLLEKGMEVCYEEPEKYEATKAA